MTEKERGLERLLAEKDLVAAKTNKLLGWKTGSSFAAREYSTFEVCWST